MSAVCLAVPSKRLAEFGLVSHYLPPHVQSWRMCLLGLANPAQGQVGMGWLGSPTPCAKAFGTPP